MTPAARGDADRPSLLGIPLGASRDTVAARFPELVVTDDGSGRPHITHATLRREILGMAGDFQLSFVRDQLAALTVRLEGPAVTVESFRDRLRPLAEAGMGSATATRCESEDGVPFAEYLATGHGRLSLAWLGLPARGRLWLRAADAGGLTVRGFAALEPLAAELHDDLFAAARGGPAGSRLDHRRPRPGHHGKEATDEDETLLGLRLGAPRAEVEAALAPAETDEVAGRLLYASRLAGLDGQVQLVFYADRLAVLFFTLEGDTATEASYRALLDWARGELGPGSSMHCISEDGVPPAEYVPTTLGLFATTWRGPRRTVDGSLQWRGLRGAGGPSEIVLEVNYMPLQDQAPEINFGE